MSIEEIKRQIFELLREAAEKGVAIESVKCEFISTMDGRAFPTFIEFSERRHG